MRRTQSTPRLWKSSNPKIRRSQEGYKLIKTHGTLHYHSKNKLLSPHSWMKVWGKWNKWNATQLAQDSTKSTKLTRAMLSRKKANKSKLKACWLSNLTSETPKEIKLNSMFMKILKQPQIKKKSPLWNWGNKSGKIQDLPALRTNKQIPVQRLCRSLHIKFPQGMKNLLA